MSVKATFHMQGGDFTMTFEEQKTYKTLRPANHHAILLLESTEDMNDEMKGWLEYTMYHGRGRSIPRIDITIQDYDDEGNLKEHFRVTETFGRRWFTKYSRFREIELEYTEKVSL